MTKHEHIDTGMEKRLQEMRSTLVWSDTVLANIDELVVVTDSEWRIVYTNEPFSELVKQQRIFLLGALLWEKLHVTADAASIEDIITKLKLPAKKCQELSGVYTYREDGVEQVFDIHFTYMPKLKQVVLVLRDVTDATMLDAMRSEFINIVSHELRTPLAGAMLYANMLDDGYGGKLTKKQKTYLKSIIESTDRMIDLVNAFLNIARIESGRVKIHPRHIDLRRLLLEVLAEYDAKAKERRIKIVDEIDDTLPPVTTDSILFREVCVNFLSNAIKYTPSRGIVTVNASVTGKDVVVRVTDTGYGIPVSEQDMVFSRFFRGSNVVSRDTAGTGLGLYLVKLIAQTLGGRVWFDSEEGKGATFWFSVPLKGGPARPGATILESLNNGG
jgi:two-component system, OmpR family, phosphate regulon sensor histidine kinase PhoR